MPYHDSSNGIYTYKRVVCVCLLVWWSAFYRPHEISYFAALPPSPRAGAGGRPRASGQACTTRARARMPYNSLLNRLVRIMQVIFSKMEIQNAKKYPKFFSKNAKYHPKCRKKSFRCHGNQYGHHILDWEVGIL